MYQYTLGTSQVESSSAEQDLVVWSYSEQNMTQQWVLMAEKTRSLQGCSRQRIANSTRKWLLPSTNTGGTHQECWVQFWPSWCKKNSHKVKKKQGRTTKWWKGWAAHLTVLRGCLAWRSKGLGRPCLTVDNGLGEWRRVRFISVLPCDRTRDHRH